MKFLENLKRALNDPRTRRDQYTCAVNERDLRSLIEVYEKVDSDVRSQYASNDPGAPLEYRVHAAVQALYHASEKDADRTMLVIMETLLPLMQERRGEKMRELPRRGTTPEDFL